MAKVLGWEQRAPIVAKCDRKRVLSSWDPYCCNTVPKEYQIEFSRVRHLSPREFVENLSKVLRVRGVVAGENYRFGYKATGDASDLVKLCDEYGMEAYIIKSVMEKNQHCNFKYQQPKRERTGFIYSGSAGSCCRRHEICLRASMSTTPSRIDGDQLRRI